MELGLEKIIPETLRDWVLAGNFSFQGILDVVENGGVKTYDNRPVLDTIILLRDKLINFSNIEKIDIYDRQQGIYAYKFTVMNKPIYVLWYDDYIFQHSDEIEGSVSINLSVPLDWNEAQITEIPTVRGTSIGNQWTQTVAGGSITLTLSEIPIIVEKK